MSRRFLLALARVLQVLRGISSVCRCAVVVFSSCVCCKKSLNNTLYDKQNTQYEKLLFFGLKMFGDHQHVYQKGL